MARTETRRHPLFARFYTRVSPKMDEGGVADYRRRLLEGLAGEVVEIGAGNGLNFPHYPFEVNRVVAVEPDPYLRREAKKNAASVRVPIEIVDGTAEQLPAPDGTFDAAVVSLVLCSVRDQIGSLQEIRRVLRPGGVLRFFEHVRAETRTLFVVQRLVDRTLWPILAGGCHTSHDTENAIRSAGFEIDHIEALRWPEGIPTPASPHILGRARKP